MTWVSYVTHWPLVKTLLWRKHPYFTLIPDQRPCSQSPAAIKYEMFCLIFYLLMFGCHYLQFKAIMSSYSSFRLGDHMLFYYLRTWSPPSFYGGIIHFATRNWWFFLLQGQGWTKPVVTWRKPATVSVHSIPQPTVLSTNCPNNYSQHFLSMVHQDLSIIFIFILWGSEKSKAIMY